MSSSGSDYSETSRSPSPAQKRRHHHHRHHRNKNRNDDNIYQHEVKFTVLRKIPASSNFIMEIFVIGISIIIQFFMEPVNTNFVRPMKHEQPLAYIINNVFDQMPDVWGLSLLCRNCKQIVLISYIVYLIYDILYSSTRSFFRSLLISLMFLFDQTTRSYITSNPSFGIQLVCLAYSLRDCQYILVYEVFSFSWLWSTISCLFFTYLACFIRFEALPIIIPVVISVFSSRNLENRISFWRKIWNTICASISLLLLCAICGIVLVFSIPFIGFPKYIFVENTFNILLGEAYFNNHNIGMFFMIPFLLLLYWLTDIEGFWMLSIIGCTIFEIILPISCVVDDTIVKFGLILFYYLVACGYVLCDKSIQIISLPLTLILFVIVISFYINPI